MHAYLFLKTIMTERGFLAFLRRWLKDTIGYVIPIVLWTCVFGVTHHRNEVIQKAYFNYGYTLSEIATHLGLHYATIGRIIKKEML